MNNEIKPRLRSILQNRQGRARAITRRELRDTLGYQNDRKLRLIIAELRQEGLPILFATNSIKEKGKVIKPAGYYIPENFNELKEGLNSFRSYIIDLCIQRRAIKRAGELSLYSSKQGVLL